MYTSRNNSGKLDSKLDSSEIDSESNSDIELNCDDSNNRFKEISISDVELGEVLDRELDKVSDELDKELDKGLDKELNKELDKSNNIDVPITIKILITFFFFTYVGTESAFGGWISTYVIDNNITISDEKAAFIAAIFWGFLTIGIDTFFYVISIYLISI